MQHSGDLTDVAAGELGTNNVGVFHQLDDKVGGEINAGRNSREAVEVYGEG